MGSASKYRSRSNIKVQDLVAAGIRYRNAVQAGATLDVFEVWRDVISNAHLNHVTCTVISDFNLVGHHITDQHLVLVCCLGQLQYNALYKVNCSLLNKDNTIGSVGDRNGCYTHAVRADGSGGHTIGIGHNCRLGDCVHSAAVGCQDHCLSRDRVICAI